MHHRNTDINTRKRLGMLHSAFSKLSIIIIYIINFFKIYSTIHLENPCSILFKDIICDPLKKTIGIGVTFQRFHMYFSSIL